MAAVTIPNPITKCSVVGTLFGLVVISVFLLDSPIWEIWQNAFLERAIIPIPQEIIRGGHVVIRNSENGKRIIESELGSFEYRPHEHIVETCSEIHRLSTTQSLICEGTERRQDVSLENCGGLALKPGLCVMPERTKFVFKQPTTSIALLDSEILRLRTPSCNFAQGNNVEIVNGFFSNFRYHGPKCEFADLNPRWLHDTFKDKLIVFVGDSHARNLFTSFVAEVRNQKHVVERHPDTDTKDNFFPYQQYDVNGASDRLRDLVGSRSLTRQSLSRACEGASCSSMTVLYLWAGFPEEYEALLSGSLLKLAPEVIITDFISKAYTNVLGFRPALNRTSKSWEDFFFNLKNKPRFIVSPFPMFGGDSVKDYVQEWISSPRLRQAVDPLVIDQNDLLEAYQRSGLSLEQLKRTSHSVCGLYDTFSLNPQKEVTRGHKIVGFETCVAPIDRAVVRIALSFASSI